MKYVYLVRAGKGHYKIGIASNMLKRVRALQTSNPNLIEIVTAKQTPNASEFERSIHDSLQAMKLDGGREWFQLTDEQALDIAVLINKSPGMGLSELELLQEALAEYAKKHQELLDEYADSQKKVNARIENLIDRVNYDQVFADRKKELEAIRTKALQNEKATDRHDEDRDMYYRAVNIVSAEGKASTSMLQRRLSIGYGRAARIIEQLEEEGFIGPADGSRPRKVYITATGDRLLYNSVQ